jgi:3-keto-disaccharide hydrolase
MHRAWLLLTALWLPPQLFAADAPRIAPPETSGMQSLFNGKDLTGWDGDPRLWSVKDGAIHGETTAENPARGNTFIISKGGTTKDFELRLSFRCNATNNSGIQYRSRHITEGNVNNNWVVRGYQHEIRNETKLPSVSGFIYDEGGKRGRICLVGEQATWGADGKKQVTATLIDQAGFEKLFKLDDWNDVVIVAKGNHIQHYLNNVLILDFTDDDPQLALKEGILALQLHAGRPMWAEFKNIRIKEIK